MLEVAVLRIGIPWTFSFSFAYVRALRCPNFSHYSYPYSVGYYHTKEHLCCHLSKCWYAPPFSLYCRTHRARDDQNCQNMSSICFCMPHVGPMLAKKCVVLLTPFAYLVQCLKRVSFFRLSFLFSSRRWHTRSCLVSWARRCV